MLREEFVGTKGVIRICKSRKGRQHNGQKKKNSERAKNDLQSTTQKTNDRATRTELNSCDPEG